MPASPASTRAALTLLLAASCALVACAEDPAPSPPRGFVPPTEEAPSAEDAPPPEREEAPAEGAGDACPPHVFCHPSWRVCRCTRNARGDVATMEADIEGDGRADLRVTHVYDDVGNELRWENDRGADGTPELVCTFAPPCPPPHPNETCSCLSQPRAVTREEVEAALERAGNRAQPLDPEEARRILDIGESSGH